MSEVVISVRGFQKRYGDTVAVKDISFDVRKGEIFALLGPNGSGKTSTLESLEGIRRPDGGSLSIAGIDPARQPRRLRSLIGVQLQTSARPAAKTVEEAMAFFCGYHGVPAREALIERLGLAGKRGTQYGKLSAGQQRRLALAIAVAHDPKVIFLDEPTAGLDVQSRAELHALARELSASGDRRTRISVATENGRLQTDIVPFPFAAVRARNEGYAVYLSENPGKSVSAILAWLEQAGDPLVDLRVERPSLEERFLELTSDRNMTGTSK